MFLLYFHLGGSELLMAHGLPIADWAAKAMGTDRWKGTGISNRGLSVLAGNSMHSASVPCFRYKHGNIQFYYYSTQLTTANVPVKTKVGTALAMAIFGSRIMNGVDGR